MLRSLTGDQCDFGKLYLGFFKLRFDFIWRPRARGCCTVQNNNMNRTEKQEHQERDIPKMLDENVKLIDGDGREYMQPKGHEHWNNGKTLFVYHQTEAQKKKPIPDATDLHAFVITLDRRSDLTSSQGEDTDMTMWERTQERLKEIPLIHAEKSPGVDP